MFKKGKLDNTTLRFSLIGLVLLSSFLFFSAKTHNITPSEKGRKISQAPAGKDLVRSISVEKTLALEELLSQSYDSLFRSRRYFDGEVKKLHDASKDMQFLWHPEQEKTPYVITQTPVGTSSIRKISVVQIPVGKDILKITYSGDDMIQDDPFYTHVEVIENGKAIEAKDYKDVELQHIYKIKVAETDYYLLGLCGVGMHGCGVLVPIVSSGDGVVVGKEITDVDFSNFLQVNDFFTKNGELYTVFDDSRYFFKYSGSNNASYNSAVPIIYKLDKKTGGRITATGDFLDLYQQSTKIISDDLQKLSNSISDEAKQILMYTDITSSNGESLVPYFDYYLGMAIIADKTRASSIRDAVRQLYVALWGEKNSPEAHLDGYKDFEK